MPSLDSGVYAIVKTQEVEDLVRSAPKIFNQHYNRASKKVGTEFCQTFSKGSRVGGLEIHRAGANAKPSTGEIRMPAVMRRMGFRAALSGTAKIDGKTMRVWCRNPAMIAHELGGMISSKKSKIGMAVDFSTAKPVSKSLVPTFKALRRGSKIILFVPDAGAEGGLRGLAHYRKTVQMKRLLRFLATWDSYVPTALEHFDRETTNAVNRLRKTMGLDLGEA